MDRNFWNERWRQGQIGFHLGVAHPLLKRFLPQLALPARARWLLPLCGKTLDIHYLLSLGHDVVGVELNELAVSQLFEELGTEPELSTWQGGKRWRADNLEVFQGDFFALKAGDAGKVDAVYDRAALVALPPDLRARYAERLVTLSGAAPQLLVTFEYEQTRMEGPPFSVDTHEVQSLYADHYVIETLSRTDIIEKAPWFRDQGLNEFIETCYRLS